MWLNKDFTLFIYLTNAMFLVNYVSCAKSKKSSSASSTSNLLDKESQQWSKASCKSTKKDHIMKLRAKKSTDQLMSCLIKALQSSNDAFLWSVLGESFQAFPDKTKAAKTCFKEASKHGGKISKFIQKWHFIGPFGIGKAEVDGDPLEEWGGVKNVSKYRWDKKFVLYSELVAQGEIKWMEISQHTAAEPVAIAPPVNWNELVMSLQSMGITEWQGWALGDFFVNEDDATVLVQCLGVHTVYIDDSVMTGDVYRRDLFWSSVQLSRGIHTLQLRLRSKGSFAFTCNIKLLDTKQTFQVLSPTYLPDLVDGKLFSTFISLPISNLHSSHWLKVTKVSAIKEQSSSVRFSVKLTAQDKAFAIAPGQVRPIKITLEYKNGKEQLFDNGICSDVKLVFKISTNKGPDQKFAINLRCRKGSESFVFTFLDHDASVQHGAAIAPLTACSSGICPVLLTLHGTTVPPQNQADSYKRMENGKWVFGVDHLWLVAPTRHGAHNWEGPGELTAMMALRSFAKFTKDAPWIGPQADEDRVVFAGHSMGGHGAWQLGTHYPDHALALVSAAGWIKKEDYGESNLFFRHDISTSHTSPAVKGILEACTAENDADKHVSNLHGLPIMIRIGAADRTVHPYYTRRMFRLLRQQRTNVTYSEIADKEHWWWDTYKTNDGGVVNDPVIRNFAVSHAQHAAKPSASWRCEGDGECGETDATEKYKQNEITDRNTAGSGKFRLTIYNPVANTGLRGVRIMQQTVPFRQSSVDIHFNSNLVVLTTENVARLCLKEPSVSPVMWHQRSVEIDGAVIGAVESQASQDCVISLCKSDGSIWEPCQDAFFESEFTRGPANIGPARRVAEGPFLIVTGTSSQQKHVTTVLRQFAVYIANLFFLTSDAWAPVVSDAELDEETAEQYNLILVGSPLENSWVEKYHGKVPLQYKDKSLALGGCTFSSPQTGAVFLAPHAGSRLALVISGNSIEGIRDAVHLATPTIPPMTRSPFSNMVPDYVITGPLFRARGPGGYLCSGFWNNRWGYGRETSSCVC
ncbi:uncharacterized protein LOC144631097 isoform X1 [Oculina patagonica]